MVVAEFVVVLPFLDTFQSSWRHLDRRIQATRTGVPGRLLRGGRGSSTDRSRLNGKRDLGRRAGISNGSSITSSRIRRRRRLRAHGGRNIAVADRRSVDRRGSSSQRSSVGAQCRPVDQLLGPEDRFVQVKNVDASRNELANSRNTLHHSNTALLGLILEELIKERSIAGVMRDAEK